MLLTWGNRFLGGKRKTVIGMSLPRHHWSSHFRLVHRHIKFTPRFLFVFSFG